MCNTAFSRPSTITYFYSKEVHTEDRRMNKYGVSFLDSTDKFWWRFCQLQEIQKFVYIRLSSLYENVKALWSCCLFDGVTAASLSCHWKKSTVRSHQQKWCKSLILDELYFDHSACCAEWSNGTACDVVIRHTGIQTYCTHVSCLDLLHHKCVLKKGQSQPWKLR